MAHDIAFDSVSNESMTFQAGQPAWHHLGQNVQDAQTWEEAIKQAHLDWTVVKAPLHTTWKKAGQVDISSHVSISRIDTQQSLGVVGSNYEILQNAQAFEFVDALIGEHGAHYESAGGLGNGSRIWCLARLPKDIVVGSKDILRNYLLFATSHDGSMSAVAKLVNLRVVCNNTLTAALGESGIQTKIKHTKNAKVRMEQAQRLMAGANSRIENLEERFNLMAQTKLSRRALVSVLDSLFPVSEEATKRSKTRHENIIVDVLTRLKANDGNAFPEQAGTAYSLLNAITGYADHQRVARETKAKAGTDQIALRSESALFGTSAELKSKALDEIHAMVLADGTQQLDTSNVDEMFDRTIRDSGL